MIGTIGDIINWIQRQPNDRIYEVKVYKKGRSLNANSYAWKLCGEIAKVLGITKEEVYKKVIKEVGEFDVVPIKKEAVAKFSNIWKSKGLGWLCDYNASKLEGYVNVVIYYGSSVYDTKQMSRLINSLVEEARMLGIATLDDIKIQDMLDRYERGELL